MTFFELTKHFILQLKNAIALEQNTVVFHYNAQQISINFEEDFVKELCEKYSIDFPFEYEKYITEIAQLIKDEDRSIEEAIETIEAIKIIAWYPDSPTIPDEIESLFINALKGDSIYESISTQKKTKAKLSLEAKYESKRRRIYNDLINTIDTRLHKREYPEPYEVAKQYHIDKESKYIKWGENVIAPVMERTKIYLQNHPDLKTTYRHVKPIREKCKDLEGGKDAKENWIKHYAKKSGLKNHKI